MVDEDHRVAVGEQVIHHAEQAVDVGGMQADGGLVEHVEHAGGAVADGARELCALTLAGGEGGRRAVEREVSQA